MRTAIFLSFGLILTACADQAAPSLKSIDGLAGGSLTSDLAVPAMTTDSMTAGAVQAKRLEIEEEATVGAMQAATVSTDSLQVRGWSMLGAPLGTVQIAARAEDSGYRGADDLCRNAFTESAHVCSADEVLTAARAGVDIPSDFDGAAVNTHSFAVVGREDSDSAFSGGRLFVVNDCDGWTSIRQTTSLRVLSDDVNDENRANLGLTPVTRWIDGYMMLYSGGEFTGGVWRLRPNIDRCDEARLACCG